MKYLLAAVFALLGSAATSESLTHLGTYVWDTKSVVGLSGLEVSDDGTTFTAISDRGWTVSGQFTRTNDVITDLIDVTIHPIRGLDGHPVTARRVGDWSDAEGLAISPNGVWISFERWAHVTAHDNIGATGRYIPDHPDFGRFSDNQQLEALAIHPDGTLYALPEEPLDGAFPLFRLTGRTWDIAGHMPASNGFAVVGADFTPLGQLYVLERKHLLGRFLQSRLRRVDLSDPANSVTIWQSDRDAFGNLEGLAIWHDAAGARVTMVSDNNGDVDILTQFVDFRLVP